MARISLPFLSKGRSPAKQQPDDEPISPTATLFEQEPASEVTLSVHPVPKYSGILIKVQPPREPRPAPPADTDSPTDKGKGKSTAPPHASQPLRRTACDIVLVIDVSGSMGSDAPVPGGGGGDEPNYGFSVLDLTKHAALTILETLDERDRLGIVTFGSSAKVLRELEVMTESNKMACKEAILCMSPLGLTNLWGGMMEGLALFDNAERQEGRVPAMMVLTDGMPNMHCPSRGYVPKLLERKEIIPAIHTFGFGDELRSGLLKSIADVGRGGYSFIPDSSMLGTVFVHALANLQSTYSDKTTLRLRYPRGFNLQTTTGLVAAAPKPTDIEVDGLKYTELALPLGNLQYGQSRDIFLLAPDGLGTASPLPSSAVEATLTFSRMANDVHTVTAQTPLLLPLDSPAPGFPQPAEIAYHVSRSRICEYLGSLYRVKIDGEHTTLDSRETLAENAPKRLRALKKLVSELPARAFADDQGPNESLLNELTEEKDGQIPMGVGERYFGTWGAHFLLSLKSAHERQICNSFKDPGPLQYSKDSPLFIQCRDVLDNLFDSLEPPPPSIKTTYEGHYDMSLYRNAAGVCFAGSTLVRLPSGRRIEMRRLRRGMVVTTPRGPRRVENVLATPVEDEIMCRMGGDVLVTPWHPVARKGTWQFPVKMVAGRKNERLVRYRGVVYSVLLERDEDVEAHAIAVGSADLWGVTLGHGIVKGGDVRAHEFFGNYEVVRKALEGLTKAGAGAGVGGQRVVVGGGVKRDVRGLVCGFVPYNGAGGRTRKYREERSSRSRSTVCY